MWYLTFTFMDLPTMSTYVTNEQFVYSCNCKHFQLSYPMQNAAAVSLLIQSISKVSRLWIMTKQYVQL